MKLNDKERSIIKEKANLIAERNLSNRIWMVEAADNYLEEVEDKPELYVKYLNKNFDIRQNTW
jgi:hypothetical protein